MIGDAYLMGLTAGRPSIAAPDSAASDIEAVVRQQIDWWRQAGFQPHEAVQALGHDPPEEDREWIGWEEVEVAAQVALSLTRRLTGDSHETAERELRPVGPALRSERAA